MSSKYHCIQTGPYSGRRIHDVDFIETLHTNYDRDVAASIYAFFQDKYDRLLLLSLSTESVMNWKINLCEIDRVDAREDTSFVMAFYGFRQNFLREEKQELQVCMAELCTILVSFDVTHRSRGKPRGIHEEVALRIHVSRRTLIPSTPPSSSSSSSPMMKYNPAIAANIKSKYATNFQMHGTSMKKKKKKKIVQSTDTPREKARVKLSQMSFVKRCMMYALGVYDENDVVVYGLDSSVDPDGSLSSSPSSSMK